MGEVDSIRLERRLWGRGCILEAMNSFISTSILDSSASNIGEEGEDEDGLKESASESHASETSELMVSRLCLRGVYGARRPEEKREE
jgi:hypothetical protein